MGRGSVQLRGERQEDTDFAKGTGDVVLFGDVSDVEGEVAV